ncbi:alpha-1-inhibitor 3-like [Macrobrachium nipponense]|uniref:alpha-1-inhibitor 3-like n=1 Tax=Macrobrachium nipponense TaxID=159736 RepID=UPI0030C839F7
MYSFERLSPQNYYRHGLPYHFKLKVTRKDGEPIKGRVMSVCAGSVCKNVTLDDNGIIDVLFPSSALSDNNQILVTPDEPKQEIGPLGYFYSSRFYDKPLFYHSPSLSSLQLEMPSEALECDAGIRDIDIPVFFISNGTSKALMRTQLVSADQVLWTEVKEYDLTASALPIDQSKFIEPEGSIDAGLVRGNFVVKVPVQTNLLSDLKVLMWYARDDGEVVSTSGNVEAKQCLSNPTTLAFSSPKATPAPKDPVTLTISATPKSVCGIGVVDRSVEILSRDQPDRLTNSAIFRVLDQAKISSYENTQINTQEYCYGTKSYGNSYDVVPRSDNYPDYFSSDVDAIQAFGDAGLLVLTDLTVETRPCPTYNFGWGEYLHYFLGGSKNLRQAQRPGVSDVI